MPYPRIRAAARLPVLILCAAAALSGCARVANVGQPPRMSEPRATEEFQAMTEPQIIFPDQPVRPDASASLWTNQPMSLVGDRRASTRLTGRSVSTSFLTMASG